MEIKGITRTFTSEAKLIEWLEDRNWDCGSSQAFREWLYDYFEAGNKIKVNEESYSYEACIELI